MNLRIYVRILAVSILICSCSREMGIMDLAEELMNERPDSSLLLLSGIDQNNLKSKKEHARFALLLSQAYDKNYIDKIDDSLLYSAALYYSSHGRPEEVMKSWYYKGRVNMNACDIPAAIIALEKAENTALSIGDKHFLGLIYRNKADAFSSTHNIAESQRYYRYSEKAFLEAGEDNYAIYSSVSAAVEMMNSKEYDKSRTLLDSIIRVTNNPELLYKCKLCYAQSLVEKHELLLEAIDIYKSIPYDQYWILDYGYYALALYFSGHKQLAEEMFSKGEALSSNEAEKAALGSMIAIMEDNEGLSSSAYTRLKKATLVQDSVKRKKFQHSLSIAQRDYYKHEAANLKAISQHQKIMIVWSVIVFVLLLSVITLIFSIAQKKKNEEIIDIMAKTAILAKDNLKSSGNLVGSLFLERLARLSKFSESYYTSIDENDKKHNLEEFREQLKLLRNNPSLFQSLETDLNKYCSNIMLKLKEQIPKMKTEHRNICSLYFAGFDDAMVQIVMRSVSIGSLKTMKSRLRSEIKNSNADDEKLFLDMLSGGRK